MRFLFHEQRLDRADKIQLGISYALQLILVGAAFLAAYEQNWLAMFATAGILIMTFLPGMIRRNYKVFLPVEYDLIAIIFIFAAIFLGEAQGYYTKFWWWDVILHTSSGILLGIAGFLLVHILNEEKRVHLKMKPGFVALFAMAFAISLGAVWEIFEFGMDQFFGLHMQKFGLTDTMGDLIVDTLGAVIISVLGYLYLIRRRQSLLFSRMIHRFVEGNPKLFKK